MRIDSKEYQAIDGQTQWFAVGSAAEVADFFGEMP
jgi:hypothetical protein